MESIYGVEFTDLKTGSRRKYVGRAPDLAARQDSHVRGEASEYTEDADWSTAQWDESFKVPEEAAGEEELRSFCENAARREAVGKFQEVTKGPQRTGGACFATKTGPESWPAGLLAAYVALMSFWPSDAHGQTRRMRAAASEHPVVAEQLAKEPLTVHGVKKFGEPARAELERAWTWAVGEAEERRKEKEAAEQKAAEARERKAAVERDAAEKLADPAYVKQADEGRAYAKAVQQARDRESTERKEAKAAKAAAAAKAAREEEVRKKEEERKEGKQKWEKEKRPKRDRSGEERTRTGEKKRTVTETQRKAYSAKDKDTRKKRKLAEKQAAVEKAAAEKARKAKKKEEAARKAQEEAAEQQAAGGAAEGETGPS